jgi:hypothetical protein
MRVISTVSAVTLFAIASSMGASLAKTSDAQKTETAVSSPSPCYSYEQGADGSWKQIPCEEPGVKPQAASKISTRDAGKAAR